MKKELSISFWSKESGNALSHGGGLQADQVEALEALLQAAKNGENVRLIIFKNQKKGETSPDLSLKVFKGAPRHDDGGL